MGTGFDLDQFLSDCDAALRDTEPRRAVKEVVARAVSDPAAVAAALPPDRAELQRLHVSDTLTVLKVVWAPGMTIRPHDHRTWATIGIYAGQEDNAFFRRTREGIVGSGGKVLRDRDTVLLGSDTIHSVTNPLASYTGAIHVYGGDFFTIERSEWDPDTLDEQPYDVERTLRNFAEANARASSA